MLQFMQYSCTLYIQDHYDSKKKKKKNRLHSRWRAIANPQAFTIKQRAEVKNNVAVAHLITHVGKSCSKFGEVPPSDLEGDSMTDRWTAGRTDG